MQTTPPHCTHARYLHASRPFLCRLVPPTCARVWPMPDRCSDTDCASASRPPTTLAYDRPHRPGACCVCCPHRAHARLLSLDHLPPTAHRPPPTAHRPRLLLLAPRTLRPLSPPPLYRARPRLLPPASRTRTPPTMPPPPAHPSLTHSAARTVHACASCLRTAHRPCHLLLLAPHTPCPLLPPSLDRVRPHLPPPASRPCTPLTALPPPAHLPPTHSAARTAHTHASSHAHAAYAYSSTSATVCAVLVYLMLLYSCY